MTDAGLVLMRRPLLKEDVLRAWREVTSSASTSVQVDVLKPRKWLTKWGSKKSKSYVFRLHTAKPSHRSIVAKYCDATAGELERLLYDDVLPPLGIPAPCLLGSSDPDALNMMWLFIEDVSDGEEYSSHSYSHNLLLSSWVARLHLQGASLSAYHDWPDRGVDYYLSNLDAGIENLQAYVSCKARASHTTRAARALETEFTSLRENWEGVQRGCGRSPRSLVHGDLKEKHLRIRATTNGRRVFAFDWELAGWGFVTTDLATARLTETEESVRSYFHKTWANSSDMTFTEFRDFARMGVILRGIVAGRWASRGLLVESLRAARHIPVYVERIQANRRALGL